MNAMKFSRYKSFDDSINSRVSLMFPEMDTPDIGEGQTIMVEELAKDSLDLKNEVNGAVGDIIENLANPKSGKESMESDLQPQSASNDLMIADRNPRRSSKLRKNSDHPPVSCINKYFDSSQDLDDSKNFGLGSSQHNRSTSRRRIPDHVGANPNLGNRIQRIKRRSARRPSLSSGTPDLVQTLESMLGYEVDESDDIPSINFPEAKEAPVDNCMAPKVEKTESKTKAFKYPNQLEDLPSTEPVRRSQSGGDLTKISRSVQEEIKIRRTRSGPRIVRKSSGPSVRRTRSDDSKREFATDNMDGTEHRSSTRRSDNLQQHSVRPSRNSDSSKDLPSDGDVKQRSSTKERAVRRTKSGELSMMARTAQRGSGNLRSSHHSSRRSASVERDAYLLNDKTKRRSMSVERDDPLLADSSHRARSDTLLEGPNAFPTLVDSSRRTKSESLREGPSRSRRSRSTERDVSLLKSAGSLHVSSTRRSKSIESDGRKMANSFHGTQSSSHRQSKSSGRNELVSKPAESLRASSLVVKSQGIPRDDPLHESPTSLPSSRSSSKERDLPKMKKTGDLYSSFDDSPRRGCKECDNRPRRTRSRSRQRHAKQNPVRQSSNRSLTRQQERSSLDDKALTTSILSIDIPIL